LPPGSTAGLCKMTSNGGSAVADRPIQANSVPTTGKDGSSYPRDFQHVIAGREKRKIGDYYGLKNFGVNHTTLLPGASSAIQHSHKLQDEFVYIIQGTAVLIHGDEEIEMKEGECMGFPAGNGIPHSLVNRSKDNSVVYLEIGDRTPHDEVTYASVDLKAVHHNGRWTFQHKDGRLYEQAWVIM